MRVLLDSTCPRCGARSSVSGLSLDLAREIAQTHVCADGVRTCSGDPVERRVYGPGERTTLPEERGQVIFPLGTRVRSRRDPNIHGTVQGYGTLFVPNVEETNPVGVYLVWPIEMIGSSSLPGLFVHVLDAAWTEQE